MCHHSAKSWHIRHTHTCKARSNRPLACATNRHDSTKTVSHRMQQTSTNTRKMNRICSSSALFLSRAQTKTIAHKIILCFLRALCLRWSSTMLKLWSWKASWALGTSAFGLQHLSVLFRSGWYQMPCEKSGFSNVSNKLSFSHLKQLHNVAQSDMDLFGFWGRHVRLPRSSWMKNSHASKIDEKLDEKCFPQSDVV